MITQKDVDKAWEDWDKALEKARKAWEVREAWDKARKLERKFKEQEEK